MGPAGGLGWMLPMAIFSGMSAIGNSFGAKNAADAQVKGARLRADAQRRAMSEQTRAQSEIYRKSLPDRAYYREQLEKQQRDKCWNAMLASIFQQPQMPRQMGGPPMG